MSPHPIRTVLLLCPTSIPEIRWESTGLLVHEVHMLHISPAWPGKPLHGVLIFKDGRAEEVLVVTPAAAPR